MSSEPKIVICPNPKCQRKSDSAILVNNLSASPEERYDACPYCLTRIDTKDKGSTVQAPSIQTAQNSFEKDPAHSQEVEKDEARRIERQDRSVEPMKKMSTGCPQHFGYLANRPKDTSIPLECLTCSKIVECMLKLSAQ